MKSSMKAILGIIAITTILVVAHPAFAQNTYTGSYATSSAPHSNIPPTTMPATTTTMPATTPTTTTPAVDTSGNGLSGTGQNTGETSSTQMYVIVGAIVIIIAASGIGVWTGMRNSEHKKTKVLLK